MKCAFFEILEKSTSEKNVLINQSHTALSFHYFDRLLIFFVVIRRGYHHICITIFQHKKNDIWTHHSKNNNFSN